MVFESGIGQGGRDQDRGGKAAGDKLPITALQTGKVSDVGATRDKGERHGARGVIAWSPAFGGVVPLISGIAACFSLRIEEGNGGARCDLIFLNQGCHASRG